jgi:protein gp37
MGDKTAIEWTDATWNPIIGCSRVGPGCDHCYAIGVVHREMSPQHVGLTIKRPGEPTDWTGEVRPAPQVLDKPLHWRRSRRIFVNSLSDLFHPDLPDDEIAKVFAVMALAPQHTFQVLTKRPQRMATLLASDTFRILVSLKIEARIGDAAYEYENAIEWPLPNVWLGTSIESDRYTFRADHLRATPAAVRWVSAEPMLGPLPSLDLTGIDWVVVGGESGPGARPMHPDWARGLRDRCAGCPVCGTPMGEWAQRQGEVGVCLQGHRAGPAFLFKQWGDWDPMAPMVDGVYNFDGPNATVLTDGQFFTTWDAWEKAGRSDSRLTRLLPTGMYRVGKKAAGRELDGRTWDEYPA